MQLQGSIPLTHFSVAVTKHSVEKEGLLVEVKARQQVRRPAFISSTHKKQREGAGSGFQLYTLNPTSWSDTLPLVRFHHSLLPQTTQLVGDQVLNHVRHFPYSEHSKNNLKSWTRDQEGMGWLRTHSPAHGRCHMSYGSGN